jgi:hypothetical protein
MSFVPLQRTCKLGDQKNFVARFGFYGTKAFFQQNTQTIDKGVWQWCNMIAACQKMVRRFRKLSDTRDMISVVDPAH